MIVLDASAVVEMLTNGRVAAALIGDLAQRSDSAIVPYLLDIKVASALRKLTPGKRVDLHRTNQILALTALPAERYPHTPLLPRI